MHRLEAAEQGVLAHPGHYLLPTMPHLSRCCLQMIKLSPREEVRLAGSQKGPSSLWPMFLTSTACGKARVQTGKQTPEGGGNIPET